MYPEYQKVAQFFSTARDLLSTSLTMKDIYEFATSKEHKRNNAVTTLNEKGRPVSYNYNQYKIKTHDMASKLANFVSNLEKDQVIALKIKNSPNWVHAFWSILMNGFRPLLIDARLPKENTENLLKQSHAVAIVTGEISTYSVTTINIDELNQSKPQLLFNPTWANNLLFCSSGTTGNIKLMIYSGENICNQIAAALSMPEETKDIMNKDEINILAFVPFHHIFGFVAVFLWYTFYGKNIVFLKDMSTTEIQKTCQNCDVTHVYAVPLFWDAIAQGLLRKAALGGPDKINLINKMIEFNTGKISSKEAGLAGTKLALKQVQKMLLGNKVRYCISGGGGVSNETLRTINGIGYPLYNGYGMTEVGVACVELSPNVDDRMKCSIGKPLYGYEFKIDETKSNNPGEGELLIKSKVIHIQEIIDGVLKDTNLEDGYMRTGDIATKDDTNRYYIKGRIKDVIINANGENIYPDEIESYFAKVEHVNKIVVLGVKKGNASDATITCVIELKSDSDEQDIEEVKKQCYEINSSLANEKKVQVFLLSKNKLPLTTTMKVQRFKVKQQIINTPSNFVGFDDKKAVKSFDGYNMEDVEPIIKQLRNIFAKTLLLPIVKINDDDHWINDLGGDSMSYVEVCSKINEEFNIAIPEDMYGKLTNINEFAEEILILKGISKK